MEWNVLDGCLGSGTRARAGVPRTVAARPYVVCSIVRTSANVIAITASNQACKGALYI